MSCGRERSRPGVGRGERTRRRSACGASRLDREISKRPAWIGHSPPRPAETGGRSGAGVTEVSKERPRSECPPDVHANGGVGRGAIVLLGRHGRTGAHEPPQATPKRNGHRPDGSASGYGRGSTVSFCFRSVTGGQDSTGHVAFNAGDPSRGRGSASDTTAARCVAWRRAHEYAMRPGLHDCCFRLQRRDNTGSELVCSPPLGTWRRAGAVGPSRSRRSISWSSAVTSRRRQRQIVPFSHERHRPAMLVGVTSGGVGGGQLLHGHVATALSWPTCGDQVCRCDGQAVLAYAVDAGRLAAGNRKRVRREANKIALIVTRTQAARPPSVVGRDRPMRSRQTRLFLTWICDEGCWDDSGRSGIRVVGMALVDFHRWRWSSDRGDVPRLLSMALVPFEFRHPTTASEALVASFAASRSDRRDIPSRHRADLHGALDAPLAHGYSAHGPRDRARVFSSHDTTFQMTSILRSLTAALSGITPACWRWPPGSRWSDGPICGSAISSPS